MATTQSPKPAQHRTIGREYGSYNFGNDKDPVLDIMRSLVELEAKVRGTTFNTTLKAIAESSGVTYGCLLGWFYGLTISPKFSNLQRVAHALGVEFQPTELKGMPRKRFGKAH